MSDFEILYLIVLVIKILRWIVSCKVESSQENQVKLVESSPSREF